MRHFFILLLATLGLSISLTTGAIHAQDKELAKDDPQGAIQFIDYLASETQRVWSDTGLTAAERTTAFRAIFEEATDISLLSRAILGRHYRSANKTQRAAYMAAMADYIVAEFDKRMSQIGFKKLQVIGTTPASGRQGHLFVKTAVEREDGDPILADWRLHKKNGKFRIVNLEIEGINLLITNREMFAARIKEVGLDGLIAELKDKSSPSDQGTNASD